MKKVRPLTKNVVGEQEKVTRHLQIRYFGRKDKMLRTAVHAGSRGPRWFCSSGERSLVAEADTVRFFGGRPGVSARHVLTIYGKVATIVIWCR